MKKRVFSALLALCLAFSLFGTALAATAETPSETASTSSSESTTVQENGTEGTDSGDSSVSSTGETGNTGTDSSSGENADSNSTELTGTDTTGNDSQTDIDSQSDDAAATAADGAADDAATADATNGIDLYDWNDWNPGGDHGGGGGGQELDQSYYNANSYVFWDTMTAYEDSDGSVDHGEVNTNMRGMIDSVQLNSKEVRWGNSDTTSWNVSGVNQLNDYYDSATTKKEDYVDLVITPAEGYYVSAVVIACCSNTSSGWGTISGSRPYSCNTWEEGNAFTASFSVGVNGSVTIEDLSSENFSHRSESGVYFILIEVSKIPTPLYVEYDYGTIDEILGGSYSTSVFADPDQWVTANNSNAYGQGNIDTANTQYRYAYASDPSEAGTWEHYANTVTDAAKQAAAAAGHYFAGWQAEYYISCEVSDSAGYNNYNYSFADEYGTAPYDEGDEVQLITNVKLTAIWKPIELTVSKTVEGLTGSAFDTEHTYSLQVQKYNEATQVWEDFADEIQLTVKGDDVATATLKGTEYNNDGTAVTPSRYSITPGIYRVIETKGKDSLTSPDGNTMYVTVSDGESGSSEAQVEITLESILGFAESGNAQTRYALNVTNSYTAAPPTTTLTLQKTFVGLSDEEVEYLINTAHFGWDINYCVRDLRLSTTDGQTQATYMASSEDIPDSLKLPGVSGSLDGGDFGIVASTYLADWTTANTNYKQDNILGTDASSSFIKDPTTDDWTLTITIPVPVTDENHYFTVFEQHQEVPGYAKINDSNATYSITAGDAVTSSGTGKFVDHGTGGENIYEDMGTEVDSVTVKLEGKDYTLSGEEAAIYNEQLTKLQITGATTISFTNNYTGKLDVTKEYGEDSDIKDTDKEFNITISPANPEKLDLSTEEGLQHGLSGKKFSYRIENKDGSIVPVVEEELESNGSFTIKLKADQTVHFTDLPAIQWVVTENVSASSQEGYTLTSDITDTNNGVVDEVTHWNGYRANVVPADVIGSTSWTDGIASVDSAVSSSAVALVTVTNTYTRNTNTLTISKHVSGPMGDTSADFTFTVTLMDTLAGTDVPYTGVIGEDDIVKSDGAIWHADTTDDGSLTGTYTLTLSDGESITLTLPYGVTATVEETNVQGHTVYSRVYNTGTTVGDNADFDPANDKTLDYVIEKSQTVTLTGVNQSVDFMNYRAAAVPTGVDTDSAAPYLVLTACAAFAGLALAGSIVAVRLRRRQE